LKVSLRREDEEVGVKLPPTWELAVTEADEREPPFREDLSTEAEE
jgi:hypothetical protein